jgi:hypothetical protein
MGGRSSPEERPSIPEQEANDPRKTTGDQLLEERTDTDGDPGTDSDADPDADARSR